MLSTSKFFFEITVEILFSVIAYLINYAQTEKAAEQQITECMASLECTCCLQF